ncbi:MAG TPA: ABC transporter ATP-binding protein [Anaerolineae bacterium]|nr:ABC transporter ATP-binding protein [Anaerolineae bacterium]
MKPSIHFDKISKRYRTGRGLPNLVEALTNRWNEDSDNIYWAVKDVSFKLFPGESLGIIGPNGAGKTTILKLLSKVTHPSNGKITVNGRLSALIELGAGFHPDLTGRENIYLNGSILGMKTAEINNRFDQIVDFAGIGQFLDTPVKRYSSGMYARLGFAIAAHVDPEVLLVDEVLAVGDYAFQQKCHARMDKLRENGTSLIFVAHNMEAVRRVCDKGMVMYRGQEIFYGNSSEAVIAYSEAVRRAAREAQLQNSSVPAEDGLAQRVMTFDAEIEQVTLVDETRQPVTVVKSGSTASVLVDVVFHKNIANPIFSMTFKTPEGQVVYDTTTRWMGIKTPSFSNNERCRVEFELDLNLLDGEYELGVDVAASDFSHYYDRLERAMGFWVRGLDTAKGIADLQANIKIREAAVNGLVT